MEILFIHPGWRKGTFWGEVKFRFPMLSVTHVAGLTPHEHTVHVVDENVEAVDFGARPDLVCISLMTPLAPRGYEIADRFRSQGVPVIMGGVHASWMTEEALQHCHAVVAGEAESVWPQVLEDFQNRSLERIYRGVALKDLSRMPIPRRDLLKRNHYQTINVVQTTRGCPYDCEFCSVTAFFGASYRTRPIDEVLRELDTLVGRFVFFCDDNLIVQKKHARTLAEAVKPLGRWWTSQSTINIAKDAALLKTFQESGCIGLFMGFESIDQENLKQMHKNFIKVAEYKDQIRRVRDSGIGIQGSFVLGYDRDDTSVFERLVEFAMDVKLDAILLNVLTPFPGTKLYQRMEREGRILTKDWSHYDMNTVVYRPARMTPEQLQEGLHWAYRQFFSVPSIMKRLSGLRKNLLLFAPMNLGYRSAWNRLDPPTVLTGLSDRDPGEKVDVGSRTHAISGSADLD